MLQRMQRLVIWAFERFYHEGAFTYDVVAWLMSQGYWSQWVLAALPEIADQPLLEVGCGTGYVQKARQHQASLTVGLDESRQMLALSRRRAAQANLVRAVAQTLPYADGSWSAVLSTFPAPYLFDRRSLAEIQRVLTNEGKLYIVDGGSIPNCLYAVVIGLIYRLVFGRQSHPDLPTSQLDPRIQRLHEAGFRVSTQMKQVGRSQVQLFIAEKSNI
ncbi:methyltransferase domain-containing protein [Herpetosiphon sp. NSE202]|uniref:class I SAM-dependent methyltransferase n=1 Tax=Herpetosiphon sp. NSE202 TaxID=3351349 RepID=UPI00362E3E1A